MMGLGVGQLWRFCQKCTYVHVAVTWQLVKFWTSNLNFWMPWFLWMLKAEAWHELIVGTFTSHKHPYFFFQGANWDTRFLMDTKRLSLRNYVASGADFLRVMAQESLGCWRFLLVTSICDHIEAPSARIASVHSHCMRQKSWNLCKHPPTQTCHHHGH